ncbi:MAG: hypothetical protein AB1714_05895 [Acidobacteriota bacterium]
MIWFAIVLLIFGLYVARVLHRHVHEAKLLRLREMVHAERMAALEKALPMPESSTQAVETALTGASESRLIQIGSDSAGFRWVRLASLAIGLISLFGGVGSMVGFYLIRVPEVQATWPAGLIAVFLGLGLLLFVLLTRGTNGVPKHEGEAQ